eukprot:80692_1
MSHVNNQEPHSVVEEPYFDNDVKKDALSCEISKKLETLVTTIKLIDSFKSNSSPLARLFADELQKNAKELVATRAVLRQCMQSVLKVESYKSEPMDKQQQETWNLMHKFGREIRKTVININDGIAAWFGHFARLRHGLVFFWESMTNGSDTPENSISEFQSASTDFCEFYKQNSSK